MYLFILLNIIVDEMYIVVIIKLNLDFILFLVWLIYFILVIKEMKIYIIFGLSLW